MKIGNNIRRIRLQKKLTLERVAADADTDTGNLSRLERGKQGYTDEGLNKLSRALGVKISDFFAEESATHYHVPKTISGTASIPVLQESDLVDGLGVLPGGQTIVGGLQLSEEWIGRSLNITDKANLAVLSARGDSMSPTFNDGDILLIDRGAIRLTLDAVYVLELNKQLFIKRVQRRMDGAVLIKSDNPLYDPHVVSVKEKKSLQVLGRVLWAWSGKKL